MAMVERPGGALGALVAPLRLRDTMLNSLVDFGRCFITFPGVGCFLGLQANSR